MAIKIRLFGPLAEIVGTTALELPDMPDTALLQAALVERFPALANERYAIAVDKTLIQGDTELLPGSEVALLPPFSGG